MHVEILTLAAELSRRVWGRRRAGAVGPGVGLSHSVSAAAESRGPGAKLRMGAMETRDDNSDRLVKVTITLEKVVTTEQSLKCCKFHAIDFLSS